MRAVPQLERVGGQQDWAQPPWIVWAQDRSSRGLQLYGREQAQSYNVERRDFGQSFRLRRGFHAF